MEALAAEANLDMAARKMRELQGRWKTVALAPRTQGEAMWRRFKAAQESVFARTSAFMAAQHEARKANVEKKRALCEQAEALAPSSDWVKTAAALQALQAEWKAIGPASRGHEKALWERFRAACDGFFSRRQEDLKKRKDEWSVNLAQKEALCAEAEALAQSTDWEGTAAQLKRLQAQWKGIGPVRRAKSEVIWQRFRTACDAFFDRYKHRDQIDMQGKAAARTQVIAELEALVPGNADTAPPEGLLERIQQARTAWQHAPELARSLQQDLAVKYHDVLARLVSAWPGAFAGSELDPDHTQKRMEKLLARVEQLSASHAPHRSPPPRPPAELLAQRWRERLAANTISGGQNKNLEETKWKEAEQEVRSAQQQWMKLGPVPATVAGPLNERFQRACRKFYDGRRRAS
jgi:DNA polymerase III psi subunit